MGQARIQVLFFGRMADIAGLRQAEHHADTLHALRDAVFAAAVTGGQLQTSAIRMSVNRVQTTADLALSDGDEVAFFSVFSGG